MLLAVIGLLGAMHFAVGFGGLASVGNGLLYFVVFSVPYITLVLLFAYGADRALKGHFRRSVCCLLTAFILSAGLMVYDVTYKRAQYRVATLEADGSVNSHGYYVFWWWWEKWGEVCVN